MMTTPEFICVNCGKTGTYSCKNCLLVVYCGAACQKAHWPRHKDDCRSLLGKKAWKPSWVLEKRTPAFVRPGIGEQFGGKKYLWGNVPALDILQLESNEGHGYTGDLRILFAASGDFRNLVKTIAQLPGTYNGSIDAVLNDHDIDIVARNVIFLLTALVIDNAEEAVDSIIHIWYSAFIRKSDICLIQQRIRPLIETVCKKIEDKAPGSLQAKTWTFGQRSLRVVLEKSSWDQLLSFFDVPLGFTAERAREVRASVTMADSRKDYRDRHLCCQQAKHRIAINKFYEEGILLPFGSSRHDFREPNPTFFQSADCWPMKDNADPFSGWSSKEVAETSSGPATADMYGKLFYHIREILQSFLDRVPKLKIKFELFNLDAVSNISDGGYLGIHRTLYTMVPLLQTPLENPHATLITLFMNAVDETLTDHDRMRDMTLNSQVTQRLLTFLPPSRRDIPINDPELIKFNLGREIVSTYDDIFNRYRDKLKFHEVAEYLGAAMKEEHTIIEKWPYRMKLRPGQPGAQEEFDRILSEGMTGKERYVEWKRIDIGTL
ncbi:hypothetical protein AK830_g11652 [Neonectria ditissima]|uniref:MYND-type domain-containing protein n=1 Tax=Neonectria ditissima TaxID=78410 RepID=A0A0P7B2Q3_9HYPO|nr:hypothetical protein AK830_g11652 [Neonectria ditissima]